MVVERQAIRYICEICQKDYSAREEAEDCENRCQRYAELAELNKLNFSSRVSIYSIMPGFILSVSWKTYR